MGMNELDRKWERRTLRDYFAAKALAGMLAYPGDAARGSWHNNASSDGAAERAYEYADAMLEARGDNTKDLSRLSAEHEALRNACDDFRDDVLYGRNQLAESNMDVDQRNEVLGLFDDVIGAEMYPARDAAKGEGQ